MKLVGDILIVEDEVNIRNALMTMLAKKGHLVRGVGTGEEALVQLEEVKADLVIKTSGCREWMGWNSSAV